MQVALQLLGPLHFIELDETGPHRVFADHLALHHHNRTLHPVQASFLGLQIHIYCVKDNRAHLLQETLGVNFRRVMRHLKMRAMSSERLAAGAV